MTLKAKTNVGLQKVLPVLVGTVDTVPLKNTSQAEVSLVTVEAWTPKLGGN